LHVEVNVVLSPAQRVVGVAFAVTIGADSTTNETNSGVGLEQPFELKVNSYTTPRGFDVVLKRISFIGPVPEEVAGIIPGTADLFQINVVPVVLLVGV